MRQIRATHHYAYRPGEWAELVGEVKVDIGGRPGRQCHVLRFDDDAIDLWPVDDPAAGYEFRELRIEHPVAVHIAVVDGRPHAASLQPISMARVEQLQAEHGRAPGDGTVQLPLGGVDPPPFDHELRYEDDGDGWQEPFVDHWFCSCGHPLADWIQTDPERTGRSALDDMLAAHAEHVRDKVALLLLAAQTTDRPDQIPGADTMVWYEMDGYLAQAAADDSVLNPRDLLAYWRDLRRRHRQPIRDWMIRTLNEGADE